ncbi:hypothetical protein [Bradyrhizobium sp. CCGUVB14]|uniref:hypothetical protein n=1 Tax=Bradyrhizobium sp. CCGUVB14 TaxID=2949628 RepID=UPI0020B3A58F|nr:hypothetical protein [Bradyrhizobium sp. CCGUVB14]MCP3442030.1 hypothetical protein [Bradyrhizobium sp. CCGUVB14]
MTELASQNDRWRLWQAIQRSRIELAAARFHQLVRIQIPSERELKSVAPLRRGLLLGLAALTALAVIAPIVAIVSLEFAIASQSASGSGGRAPVGRESRGAGSYENILQRPLFSRNRQLLAVAAPPVVVDAPASSARVMLDPSVALRGVFMNGDQAKAFLTSSDHPVGTWIALNEQWSGWRLSEVKPNEIVLEADGERQTLALTVLK